MNIRGNGFALPAVLISAVVLLLILVTSVNSTVAVRTGLQDQWYNQMAQLTAEAGTSYATACIEEANGIVEWTLLKPLRPNTDCGGDPVVGASEYVFEQGNLRTYFAVDPPTDDSSVIGEGFVELQRSSTGAVWRTWTSTITTPLTL